MKKTITWILIIVLSLSLFGGCGNAKTTEEAEADVGSTPPSDADFIANLTKGLEARWELTNSDAYSDTSAMSTAEEQKADTLFVNAELDAIGNLDDYQFEDAELKALAETYMKGLNLQKDGIPYQGTNDSANLEKTWTLGYYYRVICIADFYHNYGLTVDEKYQQTLEDFVAESTTAKKEIAIQDFVNDLAATISYTKDEESSDEYSSYYTTVIENTTEYEISTLYIYVDFLDADGVVIYQGIDSIENFQPGTKVKSKVFCSNEDGQAETMQYKITAYTN